MLTAGSQSAISFMIVSQLYWILINFINQQCSVTASYFTKFFHYWSQSHCEFILPSGSAESHHSAEHSSSLLSDTFSMSVCCYYINFPIYMVLPLVWLSSNKNWRRQIIYSHSSRSVMQQSSTLIYLVIVLGYNRVPAAIWAMQPPISHMSGNFSLISPMLF